MYLDNSNKNCLWLHVALDKGGKTTKLILQVINQKKKHSIDNAKLIGYFEGKDDRVNLESIFGPLLLLKMTPVVAVTHQPHKNLMLLELLHLKQ